MVAHDKFKILTSCTWPLFNGSQMILTKEIAYLPGPTCLVDGTKKRTVVVNLH